MNSTLNLTPYATLPQQWIPLKMCTSTHDQPLLSGGEHEGVQQHKIIHRWIQDQHWKESANNCIIKTDPVMERSRQFGFVLFKDSSSVD